MTEYRCPWCGNTYRESLLVIAGVIFPRTVVCIGEPVRHPAQEMIQSLEEMPV